MKKYFIVSDTHSFFTHMKEALDKKGFDINNQDHVFVLCGDLFDRGDESIEIYNFVKTLPLDRRILIRGNHEFLFKQLWAKWYPETHDFSNGTVKTFCQLGNYFYPTDKKELECWDWKEFRTYGEYIIPDIIKWINSDEWVNYWETEHYIFVHSFIPVHQPYTIKWGCYWPTGEKSYREDWRNATDTEWEDATWGNPWQQAKEHLNKTGKMIVCGHWHTADFFNNLTKNTRYDVHEKNPIFKSKRYKIIGLDGCTAATGDVNVLVLNEDEL